MKISLLFLSITSVPASFWDVSDSPATSPEVKVFNVSVTQEGLVIPFRYNNRSGEDVHVKLNSQYYLGSMRIGDIRQYPVIETLPQAGRPFIDGAHVPGDQPMPVAAEYGPQVSIANNSPIAEYYRYAMLTPSREVEGEFKLVAGLADPSAYCFEGEMATAQFFRPMSFHVKMSLISNQNRTVSSHISSTANIPSESCDIDTSRNKDAITAEVYDALLEELTVITAELGVEYDDGCLISQMPSIQFSIYQSDSGAVLVSSIVLTPEDYVLRKPDGRFELQVERASIVPALGINFLRNVAIHLNYAENRIGFCDPI